MTEAIASVSAGDVIDGRYAIEGPIAQGGMAVVYRARHIGTGGLCAVKLVHAHLVRRREIVALFLREARVSARIGKHPHIVEVFDAGVDPRLDVPYLAMELLLGATLEEWLERHGAMPALAVRLIFEQLGSALEQAHAAGVIHRDLKPANIFLAEHGRGDLLLKVMDFGVAKMLEVGVPLTSTQVGTPAYSAPEQMGAAMRVLAATHGVTISGEVTPATDIWPLGLIAYELLTGLSANQYWATDSPMDIPLKAALERAAQPSLRAGDCAAHLPPGFDG